VVNGGDSGHDRAPKVHLTSPLSFPPAASNATTHRLVRRTSTTAMSGTRLLVDRAAARRALLFLRLGSHCYKNGDLMQMMFPSPGSHLREQSSATANPHGAAWLVGFGDAAALEIVLYDSSGTPVPTISEPRPPRARLRRIGSSSPARWSWSASSCDQHPTGLASRARPAVQARPDSEYYGRCTVAALDASAALHLQDVMNSPGPCEGPRQPLVPLPEVRSRSQDVAAAY